MKRRPLRVLIVEDVEADAALLIRVLHQGGFDVAAERVDTQDAMARALAERIFDVVISDYSLPRFSAPLALAVLKQSKLDLPFIIVSGTVNESLAVDMMRAGAHDFMPKGSFARMIPAIERELTEAAGRAERVKMHEQLMIAERMASVGTLAAGVAHEINNPLTTLMANLRFVTDDIGAALAALRAGSAEAATPKLVEVEGPLRDAHEAAERVRLIVRDLKVFSRSDTETRGPVDLKCVIESSARMAWNEIRHRARLITEYGDVPPALGNEARLGQVFLNLLVNAAQAMPEGRADHSVIRVSTGRCADGRIAVDIKDNGVGIDPAIVERVFDPFFTTKPIGTGTGLGLAICHRIISSLGGEIVVESAPGQGTLFRTLLAAAPVTPRATEVLSTIASGRRCKILVVDDEPMIGAIVRRILKNDHDVDVVTRAREGLAQLTAGARYDLIFCDLMMPDVSGMELYGHVERLAPEQAAKFIFMTGGAFTPQARGFLETSAQPTLEKPFDALALRGLVHRFAEARPASS